MRISSYNGSFVSLIFLSLFSGFITIALFTKTLPLTASKTLYFCQQFISNTLLEIPQSLPNIIIFILGTALFFGILSFFIQLWKTQRLAKSLLVKRVEIPRKVKDIITALGLGERVYLIKEINLFSFCSGIFHQRIILTTGLVDSLTDDELEAVLLHEQSHMQNRDPFKILLGKTVSSMFFFLPIFSQLNNNMTATSEVVADQWAITAQRGTLFLRGALKKILSKPQVAFAQVSAISNPDSLEIRISKLTNKKVQRGIGISLASIVMSLLFFLLSVFLLQTPVSAFSMEHSKEPSYFACSSDSTCSEKCAHNAQMSPVSSPEQLFTSGEPQYEFLLINSFKTPH